MAINVVARPIGVVSDFATGAQGTIAARSGAGLKLANLASDEGLTPLELMDAALAGCLVLSVRIAARKSGLMDRLGHVHVEVRHAKAPEGPSRVASFTTAFRIDGDLTEDERATLIAQAHELCTVGNTLEHGAVIEDAVIEGEA
ncbi:MAG: OsmC-like protein [Hyphomicrobiales bacterium]|nr:OsmC-like protein [Hyphomicrobiales bacterium]